MEYLANHRQVYTFIKNGICKSTFVNSIVLYTWKVVPLLSTRKSKTSFNVKNLNEILYNK